MPSFRFRNNETRIDVFCAKDDVLGHSQSVFNESTCMYLVNHGTGHRFSRTIRWISAQTTASLSIKEMLVHFVASTPLFSQAMKGHFPCLRWYGKMMKCVIMLRAFAKVDWIFDFFSEMALVRLVVCEQADSTKTAHEWSIETCSFGTKHLAFRRFEVLWQKTPFAIALRRVDLYLVNHGTGHKFWKRRYLVSKISRRAVYGATMHRPQYFATGATAQYTDRAPRYFWKQVLCFSKYVFGAMI